VRRRTFIAALGGAAAWPVVGRTQQKMPVIGFLNGQSPGGFMHLLVAFREGLAESGYFEGRNVAIEYRWAEGQLAQAPVLAADLVRQGVAVIAAAGGAHSAAKAATSTIPIVCTTGGDPVKEGLVASLHRPGGNVTGITTYSSDLDTKRLELLYELVPQAVLVGVIIDPVFSALTNQVQDVEAGARALGRNIHIVMIATEADIAEALAKLRAMNADALSVATGPLGYNKRAQLIAAVEREAIPAIYETRETVLAGGLMSYGTSIPAAYRQIGVYTGRVLKGEKPADLPFLRPSKFEMVVNLKTAKALGLSIPTSLLLRADEVIE
jgi:putative tryptophan/tyrosine transport system substrate-binding protein